MPEMEFDVFDGQEDGGHKRKLADFQGDFCYGYDDLL